MGVFTKTKTKVEPKNTYMGDVVISPIERAAGTQLNKKITEYIKLIEISEQKNSFESKESNLCNWCYYWKECDKKNSSNPALYLE